MNPALRHVPSGVTFLIIVAAIVRTSSCMAHHHNSITGQPPVVPHPIPANNYSVRNPEAIYFPTDITDQYKLSVQDPLFRTSQLDQSARNANSTGLPVRPVSEAESDGVVVQRMPSKQFIPAEPICDFSWKIFKSARQPNPIANVILSPLLLQLTLSLLQSAATGSTNEQLGRVTNHISPDQLSELSERVKFTKSRNKLSMAAAIFPDRSFGINETFARGAMARDVSVVPVQFDDPIESGYTINNWISNATHNNIQNTFNADNAIGLRMLLTNAIYFRGFWKNQFNETIRDRFFTTDRLQKEVTYMKCTQLLRTNDFECSGGAQGYWVEIPYEGNEFSMVLIVPAIRHQLDNLMRQMDSNDITDIINQLSYSYRSLVDLKMPRFSIQSSFSLVNSLLKMGLVDLFTTSAQLPFLTNSHEKIKIDDVLQEAVLQVDEVGSVASVVQTVSVVTLSISDPPEEVAINVDQPFIALIVDKRNRVPLFLAKIFDP